jgi:flagellar export protein FliJ
MPKFVFQLDGVLRQRKHVEQERQRDLALVQAQMAKLQDELRALNDAVTASGNDVRDNRLVGRLDLNYLTAHRRYMLAMQRKGTELVQRMALVQRQLLDAQQALAEAAKQRKAIEKLEERQHQRWRDGQNRREQIAQDEVSMQMSYRDDLDDGPAADGLEPA